MQPKNVICELHEGPILGPIYSVSDLAVIHSLLYADGMFI